MDSFGRISSVFPRLVHHIVDSDVDAFFFFFFVFFVVFYILKNSILM